MIMPDVRRIETSCDRRRVVIPPTTQKHQKSMEHSDMEALGFQLRDYYEEVEYSLICAKKGSEGNHQRCE